MSGIHSTHRTHAHDGPRFSASDRPLPPTRARPTLRGGARLSASILGVILLAVLALVAPAAMLLLLVTGGVLWGVFQLADRSARSWAAESPRDSHPAPRRATRGDA